MSTSAYAEAPLSINRRVGDYQLTGRASTVEEYWAAKEVIDEMAAAILAAPTQHVSTPSTTSTSSDEHAVAVANVQAAMPGAQVIANPIEERTDRWGNKFTRGVPDVGSCAHGPRVVAKKKSRAGADYTAWVCVNDSPFGDFKAGKCQQEYPPR